MISTEQFNKLETLYNEFPDVEVTTLSLDGNTVMEGPFRLSEGFASQQYWTDYRKLPLYDRRGLWVLYYYDLQVAFDLAANPCVVRFEFLLGHGRSVGIEIPKPTNKSRFMSETALIDLLRNADLSAAQPVQPAWEELL